MEAGERTRPPDRSGEFVLLRGSVSFWEITASTSTRVSFLHYLEQLTSKHLKFALTLKKV